MAKPNEEGLSTALTWEKAFEKLPLAIEPVYTTERVNAEVKLYQGKLEVGSGAAGASIGTGRCSLAWAPTPAVAFELPRYSQKKHVDLGTNEIRLVDKKAVAQAFVTETTHTSGMMPPKMKRGRRRPRRGIRGVLTNAAQFGSDEGLSSILFHLPNFWSYVGGPVRDKGITTSWSARATTEAGSWRLTLDRLRNGSELIDALKGLSGYAITHVGRLARADGSQFTGADALDYFEGLRWFLSFARGFWVSPILLVGATEDGRQVWERWELPRILSRWRSVGRWFNDHAAEGFAALPGFWRRFSDPHWKEPTRLAIWWYVESNGSAGGIEGSIVLTQAAFELLSHTLLVEDRKQLSDAGFGKLPASDKLRGLLAACGIPLGVPANCADLAKLTSAEAPDGPGLFTFIRNAVVHGDTKNRRRLGQISTDARLDAWSLGLWYLELILLRLFDYGGSYSSRLFRSGYKGEEVEPVPWARP